MSRESILDAIYSVLPSPECCGRCRLEREMHDGHPFACRFFIEARSCGVCGVKDIPIIDWPWWKDGRCVHRTCLEKAS